MTMQDPLADMLTRIRNAQMAGKAVVKMPSAKLKVSVASVLKEEGYIDDYGVSVEENKTTLSASLRYHNGKPVIEEIRRASKPGLRQYKGKDGIPSVRGGLGIHILTTNKGVVSDRVARKHGVGGELICSVF